MAITDPLHAEHVHLMTGVEELRHTGDLVGSGSGPAVHESVERVIGFLHERLLPHAQVEEQVLYPEIAQILGSLRSTKTMARDHDEVKALTAQLVRAAEEHDEPMMRRLLYGLYHVILLHFAKEEEIYLPLLEEGLNPAQAEDLWRRMHAA